MRWLSGGRALRRDDQVFARGAQEAVEREFGHVRCPCCRRVMEPPRKGGRNTSATRTMGHDVALSHGGSLWVYICFRCNADQGRRTFRRWSEVLKGRGDARAQYVAKLADIIDKVKGHA